MSLRVKCADKDETSFNVYTNMTVNKFILKMAEHSGLSEEVLSVRVFEDNISKRLEQKRTIMNKEDEEVEQTLSDLCIIHTSLIFLEEALDLQKLASHESAGADTMVSINACYENKGSLPVLIDVNEILSNLLVEIKVAHGLDMDGEYCLYDKKADRYFSVEEMDWALKDFKGDSNFLKGGKVVNIEKGRPIGSNEISIKVSLYKRESHLTLYLEKSATVGQVRAAACEKFSCELELQMT